MLFFPSAIIGRHPSSLPLLGNHRPTWVFILFCSSSFSSFFFLSLCRVSPARSLPSFLCFLDPSVAFPEDRHHTTPTMAVLPDRPGIEVSVRISPHGAVMSPKSPPPTPCAEYPAPDVPDKPNRTTKYIEALSDADFSIVIKFTARNSDLRDYSLGLCIYVDGTRVQGSVIDLKGHQFARECWYVCDGAMGWEEGRWVQRALRFRRLSVGECGYSLFPSSRTFF